jgi:hypothetical protein
VPRALKGFMVYKAALTSLGELGFDKAKLSSTEIQAFQLFTLQTLLGALVILVQKSSIKPCLTRAAISDSRRIQLPILSLMDNIRLCFLLTKVEA